MMAEGLQRIEAEDARGRSDDRRDRRDEHERRCASQYEGIVGSQAEEKR